MKLDAWPTGEIVGLLPAPGEWGDADYLWLTRRTNRLVELAHGCVEVLPMPTERHQAIVAALFLALFAFVTRVGGAVLFAPFRLRLGPGRFREPDLLMLRSAGDARRHDAYWDGADLVIEVLSEDEPSRDLVTKRAEYAQAGIPEYWIVDGQLETITVLRLEGAEYVEHATFGRGATLTSPLLSGLELSVTDVFPAR